MAAPKPLPALSDADIARFWSKVDVRGSDECWLWKASCFKGGYGQFKASGRMLKANRVAYFLGTGMDLGESLALHTCDNPPCCNPAHLEPGDIATNNRDKADRNRIKGSRNPAAKLTGADVLEIRASDAPAKILAHHYGVTAALINLVRARKVWAHV